MFEFNAKRIFRVILASMKRPLFSEHYIPRELIGRLKKTRPGFNRPGFLAHHSSRFLGDFDGYHGVAGRRILYV